MHEFITRDECFEAMVDGALCPSPALIAKRCRQLRRERSKNVDAQPDCGNIWWEMLETCLRTLKHFGDCCESGEYTQEGMTTCSRRCKKHRQQHIDDALQYLGWLVSDTDAVDDGVTYQDCCAYLNIDPKPFRTNVLSHLNFSPKTVSIIRQELDRYNESSVCRNDQRKRYISFTRRPSVHQGF